jgi:CHAD domain-containing protein
MITVRRPAGTVTCAELLIFNKTVAYRFKLGEPVPDGIKRIVREEIEAAARHLSGHGKPDRDEAIHEARKNVKKIRGVLRLMRPELGEVFHVENAHFRDIGRQLSTFRDAGAVIETFDALRKRYRGEMDGRTLSLIRRRLTARKEQAEKHANIVEALAGMATALRQSEARATVWPLSEDGFSAIAPGLEATFRKGQKCMARAHKHARPENLHDWRKRVKEHWYHVRLLESLWNPGMQPYEQSLKELEDALGEDHNLVVLREKILAEPVFYANDEDIAVLAGVIRKYSRTLRDKAFTLGEHMYNEKPGHLGKRFGRMWEAAQAS